MLDKSKAVQGVLVYAEFRKGGSTTQMMFIPDVHTTSGVLVEGRLMQRTVSESSPKKQWRFRTVSKQPVAHYYAQERNTGSEANRLLRGSQRVEFIESYIRQMMVGGWDMVGAPQAVEMSQDDATFIANGKTPAKLIYRIGQVRTAAGYPADLF
jgi:hypothetical protein